MVTEKEAGKVTISVRLCTEKHKEVDDVRWRLRISQQEFVRRAIDRELVFQSSVTARRKGGK